MDPTESLEWYSGLQIVENGEDATAVSAAAAEVKPEESLSSVIGSAFSGMVSGEDCVMSGLMQQQHQQQQHQQQQPQQLRPSVLQHTSDHHHRHHEQHSSSSSRHIIQPTATHQDHHHHQSVIVQLPTVTGTGSNYGGASSHFPTFGLPSSSAASNLFLPPSFMGLSFPEFETYPVLPQHQPSLDLFDPNHWMGVLDNKKNKGGARRPSFTEAMFPQIFGGQGTLDFAAAATASQHHTAVKVREEEIRRR